MINLPAHIVDHAILGVKSQTQLDTRYLKLTGSLAEISNHSHTVLTDIGTNTHAQIDTFIGTTVPTTYLPLAGGTMVGNLIFNDNISALFGTGSDLEIFHNGTDSYIQNNTGGIVIENDASDGDITFKVNDGGVDTTVMTLDGATGNVGIGTTGPDAKLVIGNVGQIKITPNWDTGGGWINMPTGGAAGIGSGGVGQNAWIGYVNSANQWFQGAVSGDIAYRNTAGRLLFGATSGSSNPHMVITTTGNVGIGTTTPTAVLHLKAGTATASTAPLKFTSGVSLTTAVAGNIEFTTDDLFFTITTGAARKAFILDDGARLTSGKIPVATTNGRLVNLTAQAYEADLKVDYTAGDLDTEAEIITALNSTNTKINAIITKLETLGLLATS